jgi:hypothetical protein
MPIVIKSPRWADTRKITAGRPAHHGRFKIRTAQQFAVHHSQPADAVGSLKIQAGAQA